MRASATLLLTTFCLVLSSPDVDARKGLGSLFKVGRGVKAIDGAKSYGSGTLTVEQLAACLLLEQKIDASDKMLNLDKGLIEEKELKLKTIEKEVVFLKQYLESNKNRAFTAQQQVDLFNSKADTYNKLISLYNSEVGSYGQLESDYNSSVQKHNALVDPFQSRCAGKLYYEDDLVSANQFIQK